MKSSVMKAAATALASVGIAAAIGASAQAYDAGLSPELACTIGTEAALYTLDHYMEPAEGSTVPAGTPVTFSGASGAPVTFSVASSSALLSTPDIDSGPGALQAGSLYAFTSTKTTATARTVYWSVSFSSTDLSICAGQKPETYTTQPRSLIVVPNVTQEREAAERREQQEAAEREARLSREETSSPSCVVPSLKGDTLIRARRVLAKAHCAVRKISLSHRRTRRRLVVTRQSPRPGSKLAEGARVAVTLGQVIHRHG